MNGRERVLTALRGEEPDRVPVLELSINQKVIDGIVPGGDLPAMVDELDMDAIYIRPFYQRHQLDEGHYTDEWGITYHITPEQVDMPMEGPIHSMADLARYQPPDPMADHRLGDLPNDVRRFKGERAILWHQWEAYLLPSQLVGFEPFLFMLHDDPKLVKGVVEMVVEVHEALVRRAIRAGADIVSFGDDYAWRTGPMMSPAQFAEFFLPGIKRIVRAVHEEGALCFKHCDGNIWPLMDFFVEAGFDGINPFEPIAGMDLKEAKGRYGHKVCLLGNVDCGYILSEAPIAEVVADVKRCLREAAAGGGYIVTSSNSLHSSVKPENYRAMVEAVHRYGTYPLDMDALQS